MSVTHTASTTSVNNVLGGHTLSQFAIREPTRKLFCITCSISSRTNSYVNAERHEDRSHTMERGTCPQSSNVFSKHTSSLSLKTPFVRTASNRKGQKTIILVFLPHALPTSLREQFPKDLLHILTNATSKIRKAASLQL